MQKSFIRDLGQYLGNVSSTDEEEGGGGGDWFLAPTTTYSYTFSVFAYTRNPVSALVKK